MSISEKVTHGQRSWKMLSDSKSLEHSRSIRKLLWLGVGSQRHSSMKWGQEQGRGLMVRGHGKD